MSIEGGHPRHCGGGRRAVTSMATAMSGEHNSQILRSCSTFRRTWGLILRSRFSPNFCSFARIFLAGRKFFRSSGSLDRRSKYLQCQGERAGQEAAGRWAWAPRALRRCSLSTPRLMPLGQHQALSGGLPSIPPVRGPQIQQVFNA